MMLEMTFWHVECSAEVWGAESAGYYALVSAGSAGGAGGVQGVQGLAEVCRRCRGCRECRWLGNAVNITTFINVSTNRALWLQL